MSFNLFDWIREGVKRSVIEGVHEALEVIGSPADDDGRGHLAKLLATPGGTPAGGMDSAKRKRLGRSLRDVEASGG
jgi:hypothetical protein